MTNEKKNRNQGVISLREKGMVAVRGRIPAGVMTASQMVAVGRIAEEFGNGEVAMTARLNVEIPFVNRRDAEEVVKRLREAGIEPGSTGATLRSVVACKGTVCRHGCCDTQGIARAIEERYGGCELPKKLKISIAGCPNNCARVQLNDIGIAGRRFPAFHAEGCEGCGACEKVCREGAIQVSDNRIHFSEEDCVGCGDCIAICPKDAIDIASEGLSLYIGGRSGRILQVGREAKGQVQAEEILKIVGRLLDYFKENAQPDERLGDLMERVGEEKVFSAAGLESGR